MSYIKYVGAAVCVSLLVACGEQGEPEVDEQAGGGGGEQQASQPLGGRSGDEATPETMQERIGYAIGLNVAQNLDAQGFDAADYDAEIDFIATGVADGLRDRPARLEPEALRETLQEYQERARQVREDGLRSYRGYLEENAQREEVTVTESGLQYEVLEEGEGATPAADDRVRMHYRGELTNGTEFANTMEGGEPISINVDSAIQGWREALTLMKEGARYRLAIPPDLGYGPTGSPPAIPPNATLIFEVELVGIEEAQG